MNKPQIFITIPGEPVGQGRPRFSTAGGFTRALDPQKSRYWKEAAAVVARIAMGNRLPFDGQLALAVDVHKGVPSSWTLEKKRKALAGEILPASRPDIDNYVKAVMDAMNGILFKDDSQIVELRASKRYSEIPRVHIALSIAEQKGEHEWTT